MSKIGKILNFVAAIVYAVLAAIVLVELFEHKVYSPAHIAIGTLLVCFDIYYLIFAFFFGKNIILSIFASAAFAFMAILSIATFIFIKDSTAITALNSAAFALGVVGNLLYIIEAIYYHRKYFVDYYKGDPLFKKILRKLRFKKLLLIIVNAIVVYLSLLIWFAFFGYSELNPLMNYFTGNLEYVGFALSWFVPATIVYIIKRGNPIDSWVTFKNTEITDTYQDEYIGYDQISHTHEYEYRKKSSSSKDTYHDMPVFRFGYILYVLLFGIVGLLNIIGLVVSILAPARYRHIYPCLGIPKEKFLPSVYVLYQGAFAGLLQFWCGFLVIDGESYIDYLYNSQA